MMNKIVGYSQTWVILNSIQLCGTYQANIFKSFFKCEKKIEQNYIDGSAFAIVILRAKHAGATVSIRNFQHMISRLTLISDSRIIEEIVFSFLSENWQLSLNLLNHPNVARRGPICKKKTRWILIELTRKVNYIPHKNCFPNKNYHDSDRPWDALPCEAKRL